MSAIRRQPDATRSLDDPPEFDLHYRFDDPGDPTEVTVFPADHEEEEVTEQWLSIEKGCALPVEETR